MLPRSSVSRGLQFGRNVSWALIGQVVYAFCQWANLAVLTRLVSTELVGRFAYALSVTAPFFMFVNLQLRSVQATDAREEYSFYDYLTLRLVSTVLALLGIGVMAVQHSKSLAVLILGVGVAKGFEAVSDIYYGLYQRYEQMNHVGKSLVARAVLSLILLTICVALTGDVFWGAGGMSLAWMAVLVLHDIPVGRRVLQSGRQVNATGDCSSPSASTRLNEGLYKERRLRLWRLAMTSLPLGISMLLVSLNTNVPRYFIEHYLGEFELGIFATLVYVIVAGRTVIIALGQAASPRLARYYAEGDRAAFTRFLLCLVGMGLLVGVGGVGAALMAGPFLLRILYGPDYAAWSDLLVWVMVAGAGSYLASMLGYGLTATRRFRVQVPLLAVSLGVCSATCYLLVPRIGLVGAVWGMLASALVQCILSAVIVGFAVTLLPRVQRGKDSLQPI